MDKVIDMFSKLSIKAYTLILILVFVLFLTGTVVYIKIIKKPISLSEQCCWLCHNLVNPENKNITDPKELKSCVKEKNLPLECRNYFKEHPQEDNKCANTTLAIPWQPWVNWFKPKTGSSQDRLASIKAKYGDKVWKGEIVGSQKFDIAGTPSYRLEITDLHVDYDHKDLKEPNINFFDPDHFEIPVRGKGTYHAGKHLFFGCDTGSLNTSPAVIPLELNGWLSVTGNRLVINHDLYENDNHQMTLSCLVDGKMTEFYFNLEDLMDVVVKTTTEGDKITVTGCDVEAKEKSILESKGYVCTASGGLGLKP